LPAFFPGLSVSRARSWSRTQNGCLPWCNGRMRRVRAGRTITRIALAFEAGRDGFWPARWLEARGVEAHVIPCLEYRGIAEHRGAKTDRLDTEWLKRGFLGWLRGEGGHCSMARVPTIDEEDAKLCFSIQMDPILGEDDGIDIARELDTVCRGSDRRRSEPHVKRILPVMSNRYGSSARGPDRRGFTGGVQARDHRRCGSMEN
jgi:hypothetical protein